MNQNNPTRYVSEYLDLRLIDCMELMAQFPDRHFDLAIGTIALANSNKSAKVSA
jgi:hypothetical protein